MRCKYYSIGESIWSVPYGLEHSRLPNGTPKTVAEYENGMKIGYFSTRHHGANFVYFCNSVYIYFVLNQKNTVDMTLADYPEFHGGVLFLFCNRCVAYTAPSENVTNEFFLNIDNTEIFNGLYREAGVKLLQPISSIEIPIRSLGKFSRLPINDN